MIDDPTPSEVQFVAEVCAEQSDTPFRVPARVSRIQDYSFAHVQIIGEKGGPSSTHQPGATTEDERTADLCT
ncbi:hypothetical protein GCM10010376_78550 [Streptomyces violaceusniger]